MSSGNSPWHVSMPGHKPAGPFTEEQVLAALRSGRLGAGGLCWREGMSEWLSVAQVEPFAAALRSPAGPDISPAPSRAAAPSSPVAPGPSPSAVPSRSPFRRLVVAALIVALLGAVGYGGYTAFSEKSIVDKAKRQLTEGEYGEACRTLEDVADDGYLYRGDANYLMAVAATRRFATEEEEQDGKGLRRPKQRFEDAFADEARRNQARTDLVNLLADVPSAAPDALPRCLVLADFLVELKLTEGKQLAKELLLKVKEIAEESTEIDARPLETKVVQRIVQEDPTLAKDLVALVYAEAGSRSAFLPHATIQRWVSEDGRLAAPLAGALLEYAEESSASGRPQEFEQCLALAEQIHPEISPRITARRLAAVKKQLDSKDFAAAMTSLDRLGGRLAGAEADVAPLYFAAAEGLASEDPAGALRALQRALAADATLADTEKASWLWVQLDSRPSEDRLKRCQEFLRRYPESARRPEILAVVLADGVQLAQQFGRQQEKAAEQLKAAQEAAEALLAKHADTAKLDEQVFKLAERLAAAGQAEVAKKLADELLKALPQTPIKSELETAMENWKAAVREKKGLPPNLPPDLEEAANLIDREFKMITLSQPGAIRRIVANPKSVHVVEVAFDCTADKFAAEESDMLRHWVADGGILWVNNDVLSLFDIKYEGLGWSNHAVCAPAVSAQMCPIVDQCRNVQVVEVAHRASNLSHPNVVPLLSGNGRAMWSLVPYGKGWVSDVKKVDQASYDGPRFWVDFRLFCLGRIAGSTDPQTGEPRIPVVVSPKPIEEPTVLAAPSELDDALADLAKQRVIWIQLTKEQVGEAQVKQLQGWVEAGGVLWVDTELGRDFGFRLVRTAEGQTQGHASVGETKHPILEGLTPKTSVAFTLSPSAVAISDELRELTRSMTPLVGWSVGANPKTARLWLVLAVRNQGRGMVVFRPRGFDTETTGKALEQNLRTWSFKVAPPDKPDAEAGESKTAAEEPGQK